jgi:CheY-like chemotaxis protein
MSMAEFSNRVLIVDGEPLILRVYASQLSRHYALDTASSGEEALLFLANKGPYAVVISDLHLPDMDGVQLLSKLRAEQPDTVRVILTATSKQETVTEAVNEGGVFKLIYKPCTSDRLGKAIDQSIERFRRALIEKQFMTGAVNAAIQIQLDFLELLNPEALSKSQRVEQLVRQLVDQLSPENGWMVNLAARLCMVGAAIPEERAQGHSVEELGALIMGRISQLREIAGLIRAQRSLPQSAEEGSQNARILRTAIRYDDLVSSGLDPLEAIAQVRASGADGDAPVIDALLTL